MVNILKNDWANLLKSEMNKEYYKNLKKFIMEEYNNNIVYPEKKDIFNAINYTSYESVKCVIIGQDPYHGKDQACGFSFSVKDGVAIPPSLRNIYKELNDDIGCNIPKHGNLMKWAEEGVLLLNTVLTVRDGEPNSHRNKGWEKFTDKIIELLNNRERPMVFILWGNNAIEKENLITNNRHNIIKSYHPSPFAAYRGFFGSKPFSKTNEFLESIGEEPIDWCIE